MHVLGTIGTIEMGHQFLFILRWLRFLLKRAVNK